MRRVVLPGGVVAACTTGFASGMTMLRAFWDAAVAVDRRTATRAGALGRTRLCDPGELRELWARSGMVEIDAGALLVGADYARFEDFWWPFPPAWAAPAGTAPRSTGPPGKRCARRAQPPRLAAGAVPPDRPCLVRARGTARSPLSTVSPGSIEARLQQP
jgi:hypothetical protein